MGFGSTGLSFAWRGAVAVLGMTGRDGNSHIDRSRAMTSISGKRVMTRHGNKRWHLPRAVSP